MRWPSKDPADYQTRGRWEGRGVPRWLAWLGVGKRSTPYRYVLAGSAAGIALGAAVAVVLGWDAFKPALAGSIVG